MEVTESDESGGLMSAEEAPAEVLDAASQAVYRCFGAGGQLLYVGTTGNLGRRLADHAQKIWFLEVRGMTLDWYADPDDALAAEQLAIHVEQPKYNVTHKSGRLRPRKRPVPEPAATTAPVIQLRPPEEYRDTFARAFSEAPDGCPSPKQLKAATGLGRTFIHELLDELIQSGTIIRASRGRYQQMPGRSIAAALNSGRIASATPGRNPGNDHPKG